MKKVLWVKFGWSDYYRGGAVDGDFTWINENKDSGKQAHEAYNFMQGADGVYRCYVPPHGPNSSVPTSEDPTGWTVICLAKNPKHKGIHIIGWYENATLHGEWLPPPENHYVSKRNDVDHPAYDWSYCISSKTAYLVPPEFRNMPFSNNSVRQAKFMYLQGPNVEEKSSKKELLNQLENLMEQMKKYAIKNPDAELLPDPELNSPDPLIGFSTAEHRKTVELAAENAVISYYTKKGYSCERVTNIPCGFDFIFKKDNDILNIEVKGTSNSIPQFYITRNEYHKGLKSNPLWRLAMVTSALDESPEVCIYNSKELLNAFEIEPYVFTGVFIPKV